MYLNENPFGWTDTTSVGKNGRTNIDFLHYCDFKTQPNRAGETNLKVRRPLDAKEFAPTEPEQVGTMRVTIAAEPPNPNLHSFIGKAVLEVRASLSQLADSSTANRRSFTNLSCQQPRFL